MLVLEPTDTGHEATLYFKPRAPRDSAEFYADSRFGELWVGRRPSLEEMSALCGIACAPIDELPRPAAQGRRHDPAPGAAAWTSTPVLGGARPSSGGSRPAEETQEPREADAELADGAERAAAGQGRRSRSSELREACRPTADGFAAVVAELPEAVRRGRGERWVEGVFGLHARHAGNAVGYDTIAASGDHACTLHWIRNDGDLRDGDLLLIDAGVELDSLYTADVTRTLPINGQFTDDQRMVYEAVLDAQQAGIAAARPGAKFSDVHRAADRGDRAAPARRGACCRSAPRSRSPTRAASTGAGWCTAPRTTSASTCTTARRPGGRTTGRARSSPAW